MQKGTVFGIIALVALVGYIGYNEFPNQTASATNDRIFMHAIGIRNALDNAEYTNGEPVQSNPAFSQFTVIDWDNVKAADKLTIILEATANGYTSP